MKVYDAEEKILGRLATVIAKDLLAGEEVNVINSEKAFITGRKEEILADYRARRDRGKQRKGPFYPSRPERLLKRTVRGMLPYQQPRGRVAFKNLRVHIGVPKGFDKIKVVQEDIKTAQGQAGITLAEISRHLGAKF